jgi:hypothetical protein
VILLAGTFRVKDYRRSMPVAVKLQALWRAIANGSLPNPQEVTIDASDLEFDHRPPLLERDYDEEAGDFMPPQNDPDYIDAKIGADHDFKTFGRRAGAERTVHTRGSDVGEAAHIKHRHDSEKLHEARMAMKRGDPEAISRILGGVRQKSRLKPKQKIKSRGFDKRHRPMRERAHG